MSREEVVNPLLKPFVVDTAASGGGPMHTQSTPVCYEIRFESLDGSGRGLAFRCDAQGRVPMDELSERARENYLYARAVVGREFASPVVLRVELH